jgi:histidyl-tRNA synthetase
MGDAVLGELIDQTPQAYEKIKKTMTTAGKIDIYIVIAKEERRADALTQIQELRDYGYSIDYSLIREKVGRQFQAAEETSAVLALLYGDEWPQIKMKNLATREESLINHDTLLDSVKKFFSAARST